MDRTKWFPRMPLFGDKHPCVYCGLPADTSDHTPPRCLLPRKLPNDIQAMTVPACLSCNQGYHVDEMRTAAVVHTVSFTQSDIAATRDGGWVRSALDRDRTLDEFISNRLNASGVFQPDEVVHRVFERIMQKTATGLLFYEFGRLVPPNEIVMLGAEHAQNCNPSAFVELHRRDDCGYPEVTPSGRELERHVLAMYGHSPSDMPDWTVYLKGYFEFMFLRRSNRRLLVAFKLHDALTFVLECRWPSAAGPRRGGRPRVQ